MLTGEKLNISGYDMWEKESLKTEDNPTPAYNLTEKKVLTAYIGDKKLDNSSESFNNIKASGRLIGGCMDCLVNLLGTKYDKVKEFNSKYSDDGIIWFLESCDLNVFSIRRAMWQMKNAGWFSNVKGFLIGRPAHFGEEMFGIDHRQALSSLLREFNVPIIMDLDIGHMSPMMPVVCGSMADVSFDGSSFTISYDIEQ